MQISTRHNSLSVAKNRSNPLQDGKSSQQTNIENGLRDGFWPVETKPEEPTFFGKMKSAIGKSLPAVGALAGAAAGACLAAAGGVVGGAAGAVAGATLGAGVALGTFAGVIKAVGQESPLAGMALFLMGIPVAGAAALAAGAPGLALGGALGAAGGILGGVVGAAGGAVLGSGAGYALQEYLD